MAQFAERVGSAPLPFLQQSRHDVLQANDDFYMQQQPWHRSPIQCTDAVADVETINFSTDKVNFVKEKSEMVCNNNID